MGTLTIRNLAEDVKAKLRLRAARHGRSMEAEARAVLTATVAAPELSAEQSFDEIAKDVQAAFAPYNDPKVSIVDELIAERRLEAWTDTVEELEWRRRRRTGTPGVDG